MSERLYIEDFGPIKRMSFDFEKINILIGEQSTGKSTIAKLIAAINKMASGETLADGASGMMRVIEYGKLEHFKRHLKIYEIDNYLNPKTKIEYDQKLFSFNYLDNDCQINKSSDASKQEISLKYLSTTFIPADRAAVSLLSNEVLYSLNEINQDLPGYFVRFGQLFNRTKKLQQQYDFTDTLGITYKYENNIDKIEIKDGKQLAIANASSAIQTNIPLLVVFKNQFNQDFPVYNSYFRLTVVEEPELNCFPVLQNLILKYIVTCIRSQQNHRTKRRIIITTHSPYILTSLNNLMYAYQVGENHKREINKIIEEKYWVNPYEVSAYQLLANGTCESIIDESGLIMAEKIDVISRQINNEFDLMQDIKLGIETTNN